MNRVVAFVLNLLVGLASFGIMYGFVYLITKDTEDAFYIGLIMGIFMYFRSSCEGEVSSSSDSTRELVDDWNMLNHGTPAERALYNQMKRNNKNK